MSILITFIFSILFIVISKKLFERWINPLSVYTLIWGTMIISYEMKLMPYIPLSNQAWLVIISAYIFFLLGIITVFQSERVFQSNDRKLELNYKKLFLFYDDGKRLNILIWVLALLGLFAAIHHWMLLFQEYGSLPEIFIHSVRVYRDRLEGKAQGIPYIWLASYIAVFLGGLYSAHRGRLNLATFVAFLGLILKEMARFTRSGILLGLLEFMLIFILYRYMVSGSKIKQKFSKKHIIATVIVIFVLLIGSASFIKVSRNTIDSFQGTSSSLSQFEGGAFISPSIYLYISSHIGVLSRYLDFGEETKYFAQNILHPFYNFLALAGMTEKLGDQAPGYYIPYWTNSGSYLRDIHRDLGFLGIIFFPYLLGLFCTYLWQKVMREGNLYALTILTYLMIIVSMSFFALTMKSPTWTLNLFVILVILKIFEKLSNKKNYQSEPS